MDDKKYELICCVVNEGFSEVVMEAARSAGAKGGTVIGGRGTANQEAEEKFHIVVHPDKEIIMIVVDAKIKDDILTSIYHQAGLSTPSQGIIFSLPVDQTAGLFE